ncbi:hypothetical protein HYE67_011436 [Fusarium culmorum]|uniref:Uncharacterized protein n=1 Tax=Fusarium culmorum TaxID=5516 RepID=A0A2T4GHN1_FUSCU|nr:hypothetical protein FCULG_00009003 [Fusarium culmorum]QPC69205.1 hypothetical protein HYE67_011436 [Fusarium culmorum]
MAAETVDTSWMWHPRFHETDPETAGRFVHFRKTLFVDRQIPTALMISITADTRHKLYVNKKLVAFGPVKGDAALWFYDEVDISPSALWQTAVDQFVSLPIDQAEDDFLHIYENVSREEMDVLSLVWTSASLLQYQNSTGVTAPWKLSPRIIPPMKTCKSQFKAIYNVESVSPSEV